LTPVAIRIRRAEGSPTLYSQVAALLKRRIKSGDLAPGAKLPKELELARQLGVSRIPVRHALTILEREGFVNRVHGRGTFVSHELVKPEILQLTGIVGWSTAYGTDHRLLSVNDMRPDGPVAEFFGTLPDSKVTRFVRSRARDGAPFNYIVNYLPTTVARRMRREDFHRHTMVDLLAKRLKIKLGAVRQVIEATAADPGTASQLRVTPGSPILYVETRIWRRDKAPLMFSQAYFRGDRSCYSIEIPGA
jgi:GntR family transcriptional regulator